MFTTTIILLLSACNTSDTKDTSEDTSATTTEPTADPSEEATVELDPQPLDLVSGVQDYILTQVVDGELIERSVFVHTPPDFDVSANYPVLLVFHGNASDDPNDVAASSIPQYAEMVDGGAYIGVYPQGYRNSWNLGQELSTADDHAFITHIVAQLTMTEGINPDRILATGVSNGAGLTRRHAVETDLFEAVAPLSTALVVGQEPTADTPIRSIMQVHGTADPVCPYEGGENNPTGHNFHSSEQSIALWAEHNGCDSTPTTTTTSQGNTQMYYENCTDDVEVMQLTIIDGEHGFPPQTEGGLNAFVWHFLSTQ